jgi:hypothetical protein
MKVNSYILCFAAEIFYKKVGQKRMSGVPGMPILAVQ